MENTILTLDIGSNNITGVICKNSIDSNISILGVGICSSKGIHKGLINNIEDASNVIHNVVQNAKKTTQAPIDKTLVSISGSYTKGIRSLGSVNIPNGVITTKEINQVLQMALYNATIVPEYDVIHVLPISFRIDGSDYIENPLDMNGSRLEVSVHIITVKKTLLTNIKNSIKILDLEINSFVLNTYASVFSLLDDEEKRLGSCIIDIGSNTTNFVCFKGKSILYNDFLPIGSFNITNDLSIMLHTPINAAEMLKIKYGNLLNTKENDDLVIKKVKIPSIGTTNNTKEVNLDSVQTIIHARVEEILILIKDKLTNSGTFDNSLDSGIVLTGGLSQLKGIRELSQKIFKDIPVKISSPSNIKNSYLDFCDPTMSTTVGLILYALNTNPNFELDSNKVLLQKNGKESRHNQDLSKSYKNIDINSIDKMLDKSRVNNRVSKFWNKVSELF